MVMIEIENIKKFMAGFLGGNLFDDFLMSEGKLSMNIAYEFDGKILKEFYDTEEWEEMKTYPYVMWQEEKEKIIWYGGRTWHLHICMSILNTACLTVPQK